MQTWSNRVLLALAFSAASTLAFAAGEQSAGAGQAAGTRQLPSFERIDADNNGYLEQNEVQDIAGFDMQEADGDNDGRVNVQEFEYAKRNLMPTRGKTNLPGVGKPNVPADIEVDQK